MRSILGIICGWGSFAVLYYRSWFWILGWILSILTIAGNGFTVLLVISQRRPRTKTNALIVSLAVAGFLCWALVVPSLFFCRHDSRRYASLADFIRWLFPYGSIINLGSLVLDRYMAVVKPLKYVNFMPVRRITQLTLISWFIPLCLAICSVFIFDT